MRPPNKDPFRDLCLLITAANELADLIERLAPLLSMWSG